MPEVFNDELVNIIGAKRSSLNALASIFYRLDKENGFWHAQHKADEIVAIKAMAVEFDINTDDWEGNDSPQ